MSLPTRGVGLPSVLRRPLGTLWIILEMIKFEHTLFALPFALMSAFLAAGGWPAPRTLGWILLAMVGARSSAMSFNRLVDLEFDRRNPRTAGRALPAGRLTTAQVWLFWLASAVVFVFAAGMLNRLALLLSPVALAVLWGYSYTKRFTALSHLVLGFALGIAPVGAWIAVRGRVEAVPLILCAAVTLWTGGFDILYACQDIAFDRQVGLHSIPARLGVGAALAISAALHVATLALLLFLQREAGLGSLYLAGVGVVGVLLAYEHAIVRPGDLSRLNTAFFTTNGFVSLGLMFFTLADVLLR
ncbi:MAG: UbiA-like polyprenyltransferase [Armatimonadota bacterium]|nr:UbiA-like polyprenyltransferase [Armatimonadota bacterium]